MTQLNTDEKRSLTHAISGAAMEVHQQLGPGLLEGVHQEDLAVEMAAGGIPFRRDPELTVRCKRSPLRCTCKADSVCFESLIVELKALATAGDVDSAPVISYLKTIALRCGLLLNLVAPRLEINRLILDLHLCSSMTSVDDSDA